MKDTKKYLIGVALGFVGIILYTFALEGYEHVTLFEVLDILKQAALPFIFTEMWVAIGVEGFKNLKEEFINLTKKFNKKVQKEGEA